ncbi:DNA photolyase family protein, partial [Alphaproteobacteria bacterium]|nr:DNA photolyase family protein [Alphaproteobacteria bacterium]
MNDNINIYWIRQDLRLMDNPALTAAVNNGPIIPVYILDEESPKEHKLGQSSRLWLHHSLIQLNRKFDNKLLIAKGNPEDILINICDLEGVNNIFWNRVYEPWSITRDKQIKQNLSEKNIQVSTFNSSLLWEPWDVKKNDNTPYRVFTPYFRRGCLNAKTPRRPIHKPDNIIYHPINCFKPIQINDLNLQSDYKWKDNIIAQWSIGEDAAQKRLNEFVDNELDGYKEGRNFPTKKNVSRLSPYLHWGEISPNTVWYKVKDKNDLEVKNHQDTDHFLSEMGWREFSHSLLYYFPELPKKNLQKKFDKFSWNIDETKLKAWQRGKTGYPIVDAGMRELWLTGYMHNRLRMIVGSFLVKNLLLHWNEGEK